MARKGSRSRSTGSVGRSLAIRFGLVGLVGGLLVTIVLVQNVSGGINDLRPKGPVTVAPDIVSRAWGIGLGLAVVTAVICGIAGFVFGSKVASRIKDIGMGVSKLGRGGSEVKVRISGNDEVATLGRSVQYLANDLADLLKSQESSGGAALVSMDPLVKQLRDKTVPQRLAAVAGYEVDGALSGGSRGGLDYFDLVTTDGDNPQSAVYVVSAEGHGAISVYACRLARDELHRALAAGATPRKALAHTNKVCKTHLPAGCCAKATLLAVGPEGAKLYQAGARTPLLICQRGEVLELNAEGIAIGLDDGPVFEKSLRPQEIEMSPGTRLVLGNDALLRCDGLLDLLRQHSPRHTNMFMNVVLGGIEQDAGADGLREDVLLVTVKKAGQA